MLRILSACYVDIEMVPDDNDLAYIKTEHNYHIFREYWKINHYLDQAEQKLKSCKYVEIIQCFGTILGVYSFIIEYYSDSIIYSKIMET